MKKLPYIVFALVLFILIPFFIGGIGYDNYVAIFGDKDFVIAFTRSFTFALITSLVVTVLSFVCAVALEKVSFFSNRGKNLSLLILPFCLGNTSVAFIFKILLDGTSLFDKTVIYGGNAVSGLLILIQVWQYLFLFIYINWINNQGVSAHKMLYVRSIRLGFFQKLKDVYLPNSKNTMLLTALIVFIFSFYEGAKSQFIFKASAGTGTELLSNYLERSYKSISLIKPELAINQVYAKGLLLLLILSFFLFVYFFVIKFSSEGIIRSKALYRFAKPKSIRFGNFYSYLFVLLIISPIVGAFLKFDFALTRESAEVITTLFYTLLTALIVTFIAILLSISIRVSWYKIMNGFNEKSITFFILLFLLIIVPPICILLTGFYWMKFISYSSDFTILASWEIGHVILTLPLLTTFLLVTHFRYRNNELSFMRVHKVSNIEIIRTGFFKRFKIDYLLVLIFAFAYIWSEDVLNNIFSDNIKTFASSMKMYIYGRATDNAKAFVFLLISLLLAVMCVIFWRKIIDKVMKIKANND
ncbi:MAG: hypothetical protein ACTTKO_03835 [Candidatus Limimorpha sp.]